MISFIGVDLGWYGKPTGVASILEESALRLSGIARLASCDELLSWIHDAACDTCVVGVDAPLVIPNATGRRRAENDLTRDFHRFHAGCHSSNLSLPFAQHVLRFSADLSARGFRHGPDAPPRATGRYQIEVHQHAATINFFGLSKIFKYKRGRRAERLVELGRLRDSMIARLPELDPPFRVDLPRIPERVNLKPVEDQIDAVLCAISRRIGGSGPESATTFMEMKLTATSSFLAHGHELKIRMDRRDVEPRPWLHQDQPRMQALLRGALRGAVSGRDRAPV